MVVIVPQSYLCIECTLLMFSFELFSYGESQSNIIIIVWIWKDSANCLHHHSINTVEQESD